MNKRLIYIFTGVVLSFGFAFLVIWVYDYQLHKQADLNSPTVITSYWDKGYFQIAPERILEALERGDTDVFTQLQEEPQDVQELTNITISWTQDDFLKIASAVGKSAWDDPMSLQDWNIYYVDFGGYCDGPPGFYSATFVYFKTGDNTYITRIIEIEPYFGRVRWGDTNAYPIPILRKWQGVDLQGANLTADDAARIVGDDVNTRFQIKNNCGLIVGSPQNNDPKNWYLHVFADADLVLYIVNMDTGNLTVQQNK